MTKVCGNLLGSLSRSVKQNAERQTELPDEAKKPVFRTRLVAEPSDQSNRNVVLRNCTEPKINGRLETAAYRYLIFPTRVDDDCGS